MTLQNAVVALLVQGASHSVQVADSGSSNRAPDHHASSSPPGLTVGVTH